MPQLNDRSPRPECNVDFSMQEAADVKAVLGRPVEEVVDFLERQAQSDCPAIAGMCGLRAVCERGDVDEPTGDSYGPDYITVRKVKTDIKCSAVECPDPRVIVDLATDIAGLSKTVDDSLENAHSKSRGIITEAEGRAREIMKAAEAEAAAIMEPANAQAEEERERVHANTRLLLFGLQAEPIDDEDNLLDELSEERQEVSHSGMGDFAKKDALINAMLGGRYEFMDDMTDAEREALDIERQTAVMRAGWNAMSLEELEALYTKSGKPLPYENLATPEDELELVKKAEEVVAEQPDDDSFRGSLLHEMDDEDDDNDEGGQGGSRVPREPVPKAPSGGMEAELPTQSDEDVVGQTRDFVQS